MAGGLSSRVTNEIRDAESDPPIIKLVGIAVDHRPLDLGSAAHRIDDAGELSQHPVAGRLDDPAVVFGDFGVNQLLEVGFQPLVCTFLIRSRILNRLAI